jgi:hypothetical protein
MRAKPDVSDFSGVARDPNEFLDGGETEFRGPAETPPTGVPGPQTMTVPMPELKQTVQKMFRLRPETAHALRMGAAQESADSGRRVTETEIVERLLRERYGL